MSTVTFSTTRGTTTIKTTVYNATDARVEQAKRDALHRAEQLEPVVRRERPARNVYYRDDFREFVKPSRLERYR